MFSMNTLNIQMPLHFLISTVEHNIEAVANNISLNIANLLSRIYKHK